MNCTIHSVFLVTLFFSLGAFKNHDELIVESHDICKDELCLKGNLSQTNNSTSNENYEKSTSEVDLDFNFANDTNILSYKEIYFMATSKGPLDSDFRKSISTLKFEEGNSSESQSVFERTEKITSLFETIEYPNTTDAAEVYRFSFSNISSPRVELITISNPLTTVKPNVLSTQFSPSSSPSFVAKNSKKKDICFCDLKVNQCDVNCCCDEDCSIYHFKIFTKCIEEDITYDTKYCYKTNFIYGNNTSKTVIQSSGGLFCIVRENLVHSLHYKTELFTSLEAFNKSLPKNFYTFSYKPPKKLLFRSSDYLAESPVWALINGELTPFKIPYASVGLLCNSELNIKYLVDQMKICYYQYQPEIQCGGNSKLQNMFHYLRGVKIISNPNCINESELYNSSKICKKNICIGMNSYLCQSIDDTLNCSKITENSRGLSGTNCWSALSHVQYRFLHNGSEGITRAEAYLWVKELTQTSEEFTSQLLFEVRYNWMEFAGKVFKRSGNPGYLTGKPILAGEKVYSLVNGTSNKKEAIKLSLDSRDWLSVLGSKKGLCSSSKRIPIHFRENSKFMCSIKLGKSNFSKENCFELQNNIFKLLIGNNVINEAKENFFNKFVATFGNSRVEETGDWVQVLIDFFPIVSSQTTFKSNHYQLTCKNIITDLSIDIIYSKIGSFLAPQAKILGVSFRFGSHKDLSYYCDTPGCENTSLYQYFKLSSAVQFIDVSKPAVDAFSEPISLEAKLPHDFFYPFFSKSVRSQVLNKFLLIAFLLVSF